MSAESALSIHIDRRTPLAYNIHTGRSRGISNLYFSFCSIDFQHSCIMQQFGCCDREIQIKKVLFQFVLMYLTDVRVFKAALNGGTWRITRNIF